jgi:hypothetical protein
MVELLAFLFACVLAGIAWLLWRLASCLRALLAARRIAREQDGPAAGTRRRPALR